MNASDRGQLLYRLADLIERDREYLTVSSGVYLVKLWILYMLNANEQGVNAKNVNQLILYKTKHPDDFTQEECMATTQ